MKILHITSSMDPAEGGISQAVRSLQSGLSALGIEGEVLCLDDSGSPYLRQETLNITCLGPGIGAWKYSSTFKNWLRANLHTFDAVIVHGLWQYHSFISAYLLKKGSGHLGVAYFVMPHGMLDPYFQRAKERRLKAIRNWLYWKLFEHRLINKATGLLFTCESEMQLANETFVPYRPKKTFNVGLGINHPPVLSGDETGFFDRFPLLNRQRFILYIARIHPKKGIDLLVTAYKNLKNSVNDLPKLVVAGPGLETEFGHTVQQLADNDGDIFFTGMLSGDAKWQAFRSCEAFVLPSHQENFGVAVVEALACGKPVLISNQVNIWREIQRESAGIIGLNTVTGIKEMLSSWVAKSATERLMMSEHAELAYKKYFTIEEAARKLALALTEQ